MAAFPMPCHGCMTGICASNGYCVSNPQTYYCGLPWQFPLQGPVAPVWFDANGSPIVQPVFFPQYGELGLPPQMPPAPVQFEDVCQEPYLQPQQGQRRMNRKKKRSQNNLYYNAQEQREELGSSTLESAIALVKTDPQATLFSIDGKRS